MNWIMVKMWNGKINVPKFIIFLTENHEKKGKPHWDKTNSKCTVPSDRRFRGKKITITKIYLKIVIDF